MGTSIEFHKVADRSGDEPARDPETGELSEPWPLKHVTLVGDPPESHDFPEKFVMRAIVDGWLSIMAGNLVFHLKDGDLTYKITGGPERKLDDGSRAGTFAADLVAKGEETSDG